MPTTGAYEFKLAACAIEGIVEDELKMTFGEWGWHKVPENGFLAVYACCPDCGFLICLWRRFGDQVVGHQLDSQGNLHPSVAHSYKVADEEKCGFHTQPTKLLNFVDLR